MAHTAKTLTLRDLPYSYLHLSLYKDGQARRASPAKVTDDRVDSLDILTARKYISSALEQQLGLSGMAIAIDFLKIHDSDIWLRLPREDGPAVKAALSQWSTTIRRPPIPSSADVLAEDEEPLHLSWTIRGQSEHLGELVYGDGQHLFTS